MRPSPLQHPRLTRLLLTGCTTLALLGTLPAHALGRLGDVQLIDRDSGQTLPVYRHQGEHWVAGRPGARYAVALRNTSPGRVLSVVSVDGVNVISGETADLNQTGYVLGPWQSYAVSGWRKSDNEVAAFHFTSSSASYAERTGRPANVGVIGVALFREKLAPPPPPPPPLLRPEPRSGAMNKEQSAADEPTAERSAPLAQQNAGTDSVDAAASEPGLASRRMAPAAPAPRLGTGHGARESDRVGHTRFERRSEQPDEIVRIRYDSLENLVAMGIVVQRPVPLRPNPFPAANFPRYAPDPS